ncbi:MAG: hypothetical protein Q8P18_05755 [Pseudomonadota bacterium]|nr:hypothetical protein [Pseudomonadota bacterium]
MTFLRSLPATFPAVLAALLCGTAAVHRVGLHSAAYTTSPLVSIEVILALVTMFALVAQLPVHVAFIVLRRWRWLGASLLGWACGLGLLVAAFAIDAPTLLYMT